MLYGVIAEELLNNIKNITLLWLIKVIAQELLIRDGLDVIAQEVQLGILVNVKLLFKDETFGIK